MMDPLSMLAALGPLVVDLGKSLIGRIGGQSDYKPLNVAEWLQMRGHELEMFKAMNSAGAGQDSYPWVEAVVRLQRPAVAAMALGVWAFGHVAGMAPDALASVDNFAGAVGFYLFGDRTLFHAKRMSAGVKP